jgi:hypothetical protein
VRMVEKIADSKNEDNKMGWYLITKYKIMITKWDIVDKMVIAKWDDDWKDNDNKMGWWLKRWW